MDRINKAREEGWKNIVSSLSSTDDSTEVSTLCHNCGDSVSGLAGNET